MLVERNGTYGNMNQCNWLVVDLPSEKYEFVSWDDEILNIWKNKTMFQTTNQNNFR